MSGLFATLGTAKSGMMAQQGAITVTSHNLSNVNTPGYSRQQVSLKTNTPYSNPSFNSSTQPGQVGTGVSISSIDRVRNSFYDYQFRGQAHKFGENNVALGYSTQIENIFNEPSETGISSSLNKFFNSWHELSKNPNNLSAKNIVIQEGKNLTNKLNSTYQSLEDLKDNINKEIDNNITQINNILTQINELDDKIRVIEASGKNANDLLDKKDALMDELSYKFDIKENSDLLKKDQITKADLENVLQNGGNLSGELQGLFNSLETVESYQEDLDNLTSALATEFNNILNPILGFDLFVSTDGNPINSSNVAMNDQIVDNVSLLDLGDNASDICLQLSDLANKKITIGNKADIRIQDFYNHTIERLGFDTKELKQNVSNLSSMMATIDQSRLSESGVSIDEEFANLIQFQRAYQASSKVISIVDELLDVVVNGLVR